MLQEVKTQLDVGTDAQSSGEPSGSKKCIIVLSLLRCHLCKLCRFRVNTLMAYSSVGTSIHPVATFAVDGSLVAVTGCLQCFINILCFLT